LGTRRDEMELENEMIELESEDTEFSREESGA
jgi:hypothetical protein